jgi:hypothetical protein
VTYLTYVTEPGVDRAAMVGDIVSLCKGCATGFPLARKTYIVASPSPNVFEAEMLVEQPKATEQ